MKLVKLVTKREAAEILGVDPSTVQRLMERGDLIPADEITSRGRTVLYLYSRTAVERLAKKRAAA